MGSITDRALDSSARPMRIALLIVRGAAARWLRRPRRRATRRLGDDQRLRHGQAAGHDRRPRLDARRRRRACGSRCASACSTRPTRTRGRTSRTPTRAGARSAWRRASRRSRAGASASRSRPRPVDAARRRAVPLAQGRRAATHLRGRHRGGPPVQRRAPTRRATPPRTARWELGHCRWSEEARVVGDDPGDAELLQPADARPVVDGPHVELAAGLLDGLAPGAARPGASGTSARRSGPPPCAP